LLLSPSNGNGRSTLVTPLPRCCLRSGLYCLGHINESLLEARAIEVGFGKAESTLVIAGLALTVFVAAWPLGRLDDRYGPRVTFAVGMVAHILADMMLMASGTYPWAVFASLAFMGVHMVGVSRIPLSCLNWILTLVEGEFVLLFRILLRDAINR